MSKKYIDIDLFDGRRPGNQALFRLFDDFYWSKIKEAIGDPDDERPLNEVLYEILEV